MIPLNFGDVITIRRSRRSIRLLHLAGAPFSTRCGGELNWSRVQRMIRLKDIAAQAGTSPS
jgi:hypothetical protein